MSNSLLILHGALGCKKQFKEVKQILSEHLNVIDLNFDGHGQTDFGSEFSIDGFTLNVKAFLEREQLEKVIIFGYSMGGYVALNLALKHPKLVQRIITLGTKFDWSIESAAKEVKMLNPEKIEEKVPAFAKHLSNLHKDWKSLANKTADLMTGLAGGYKLTVSDLKQITHPVTIGLGELDKMVSEEESKKAVSDLANGVFRRLGKTPHPIEKVDPSILAEFIKEELGIIE